ncbi:transporter substrate-binding domain-containing protein [Bartonella sp. DGB2]|uniref:transporter substrate-binding domain-containing protein n=1 Tax=Bartonella sp. DGB2 TaxID=3388426 RepID=UPI00398F9DAD
MKHFKKYLAFTALTLATTSTVEAETIRFASEGAYPPFNMVDSNNKLYGFEIELVKAMCDEIKANCPFTAQDWEGLMPGLLANKYDAVIASISITDERKAIVDFSDPYYTSYSAFAVLKNSPIQNMDPKSFINKSIGAQAGTIQAMYAEDTYAPIGATVKLYSTAEEANNELGNQRVDAVINDNLPLLEWLNNDSHGCCRYLGKVDSTASPMAIAIRKNSDLLKEKLNRALAAIQANGTYTKLKAKYFRYEKN